MSDGGKGRFIAQVDETVGLGPIKKISGDQGPVLYPDDEQDDAPAPAEQPKAKPKPQIHIHNDD
jgi:hypothetical protein